MAVDGKGILSLTNPEIMVALGCKSAKETA